MTMKVVSGNSETDIARSRALNDVEWALRNLAANILRVVRGAGKPDEFGEQMIKVVHAMFEYRDVVGHVPQADALRGALDINASDVLLENISDDEAEKLDAKQEIIRGALQIAASRLLGQSTQESTGSNELIAGVKELRGYWERRHGQDAQIAREAAGPAKRKAPARGRVSSRPKASKGS